MMVDICECCHEPLETEEELLERGESRCAGYCVECSKDRCDGCEQLWEDCECEDDEGDAEEQYHEMDDPSYDRNNPAY